MKPGAPLTLPIDRVELHAISIPFIMSFAHATANRSECDSLVWIVGSGPHTGIGEAVFREYVSGSLEESDTGGATEGARSLDAAARLTRSIVDGKLQRRASVSALIDLAGEGNVRAEELPVLCGLEIALLDLLCSASGLDIYDLVGRTPERETIIYGGTVPLLETKETKRVLSMYRELRTPNLRIKIDRDLDRSVETIAIARSLLGDSFDLRIDANGSLTLEEADAAVKRLGEFGIRTFEEPVGRNREAQIELAKRHRDVTFVADESALTRDDLEMMHNDDSFDMINVRLSKNGGLIRSVMLAGRAAELGIDYQLGCQVGETGVLSAAGRAAAAMMERPRYADGSYDRHLLGGNLGENHLGFGPGGVAPVIRGKRIGYEATTYHVERWSVARIKCL